MTDYNAKICIAALVTALCGCSMSNEEVISESNKCKAEGFNASIVRSGLHLNIIKIECLPKPDECSQKEQK